MLRMKFLCVFMMLAVISLGTTRAQETIKKEVKVVKPYEPKLSDAYKINLLPEMSDTVRLSPDFNYQISPKNFQPVYSFKALKPAKMEGEPIPELYHSYLKLGFGTYTTPYGELNISSLRSRKGGIGVYLHHISSYGKLKLDNDNKVFSGYGDSKFRFYGKRTNKVAVISGNLGANQDWVHSYGYQPELDTSLVKEDIRQSYLDVYGGFKIKSAYTDSSRLHYLFQTNYHYVTDRFNHTQHEVSGLWEMQKKFGNKVFGVSLDGLYLNSKLDSLSSFANISFEPWFAQNSKDWNLRLALNTTFEVDAGHTTLHLYPVARLQFNIVPDYLYSYVGVDGSLEQHSFRESIKKNPFMVPGLNIKSTDRKLNFFGGFNGSFNKKSAYHLRGSFALTDQMYFFVNDTLNGLGNNFGVVYDDIQLTRIYGEVSTLLGDHTDLFIKANYYNYKMSALIKPWNKPSFDATLTVRYNLKDKILVGLDTYYVGNRFAKSNKFGEPYVSLKGFVDLNLKLEYRYTKILSAFLRVNNLLGQNYQIWNQYPVQKVFILAGFSYSL